MMKPILKWSALAAFVITGVPFTVTADDPKLPNIIVIMADDLGWMDLHCQGNQLLDTAHLDRLASQGMRFTDGYAAAPVCTPTRAAMMTGLSLSPWSKNTGIARVLTNPFTSP